MLKYWLMAVENNNSDAMVRLGIYYQKINDIPNMLKYYLMAIENAEHPHSNVMLYLGKYYYKINDIPNMLKYLLMAAENNNSDAMVCLGLYYREMNDIPNMMKYYLMAIENVEHPYCNAMLCLGNYYHKINDIPNMLKYLLMAIKNGKNYELFDYIFNYGKKHINYDKMIEITDIIIDGNVNIDKYHKIIFKIISKFNKEEQSNIKTKLKIKTKQDIEIELRLKHFSKDDECLACYRNLKCIPYYGCNHYFCVECIIRLTNEPCPYCRY
jgi:tetratricopeptide (TPR) repeat protein